jgi:hypothetical protein
MGNLLSRIMRIENYKAKDDGKEPLIVVLAHNETKQAVDAAIERAIEADPQLNCYVIDLAAVAL